MDEKLKLLAKVTRFCRKHGIIEVEMEEIKLKFGPAISTTELPPPDKAAAMPSDTDMLFWSSEKPELDEEAFNE